MTDIDTTVVEQTLRIAARPETVWQYWTDPQHMCDWWGTAELDPQPGGTCRVEMDNGGVMQGEFHWVLVLTPAAPLLVSLGAWSVARKPLPSKAFTELKAQIDADAQALRTVGARS